MQNAPRGAGEHSVISLTFIKLPFVIKIIVLSIFGWPLKTGFTVHVTIHLNLLTLCIRIDFLKHIDRISMGLPIMYFKGSQVA